MKIELTEFDSLSPFTRYEHQRLPHPLYLPWCQIAGTNFALLSRNTATGDGFSGQPCPYERLQP